MILIFVILAFGMSLISQGQETVSNETQETAEYQSAATSADILMMGLQGLPWVFGVFAVIGVFAYLNRKY